MIQSNKNAIKYGLIAAGIYIALVFLTWASGTKNFVYFLTFYIWIPVVLIIVIVGALQERKLNNGYISFQQVLKFGMLAYLIYELGYYISMNLLYNVIDTELPQKVLKISVDNTRKMLQNFGVSADEVKKSISKIEQTDFSMTFKSSLLGLGQSLIFDFIKTMLIALVIKREEKLSEHL